MGSPCPGGISPHTPGTTHAHGGCRHPHRERHPEPLLTELAGFAAGRDAEVEVRLGGQLDPGYPALTVRGRVRALAHSPIGGREAVLHSGGVAILVTERRHPFHRRADFLALDLDPLQSRLVVVKIGYLEPELAAMARSHRLVLSSGAVDQDWTRFPYRRVQRPLFPLDRDFAWTPRPRVWTPGERT